MTGSYGKVKLGTHRLTGQKVAVKMIPKHYASQLTRELHHHRRLHHDNIIQLYEIIATESHIWMVLEYCPGGELFDYLCDRGALDEWECRSIFGQLCLAVAFVHSKGVVHRDLKLENILLDDSGNVKLGDFGFTREYEGKRLMETFCGTTGYAAPEMLAGTKYTGEQVDIWSLGIILYILLCGGLPFDDDDESIMKQKIIKGDYEIPSAITKEAQSLIRSILKQNASERPSIKGILSHEWFTLATDLSKVMSPTKERSTLETIPDVDPIKLSSSPEATSSTSSTKAAYNATPNFAFPSPKRSASSTSIPTLSNGPLRSPSRTKTSMSHRSARSSVSSLRLSLSNALQPLPDFVALLSKPPPAPFSQPSETKLLNKLTALGMDTNQFAHSVAEDACDSASALWYLLLKQQASHYPLDDKDDKEDSALSKETTIENSSSTTTQDLKKVPLDLSQDALVILEDERKNVKLQRGRGILGSRRGKRDSISIAIDKMMHPRREASKPDDPAMRQTAEPAHSPTTVDTLAPKTNLSTVVQTDDTAVAVIGVVRRKSKLLSALKSWIVDPNQRKKKDEPRAKRRPSRDVLKPIAEGSARGEPFPAAPQTSHGSQRRRPQSVDSQRSGLRSPRRKRLSDSTIDSNPSSRPASVRSLRRSHTSHSKSSSTSSVGSLTSPQRRQFSLSTASPISSVKVRRLRMTKRGSVISDDAASTSKGNSPSIPTTTTFIAEKKRSMFAPPRRKGTGSWGRSDLTSSSPPAENRGHLNSLFSGSTASGGFGQAQKVVPAASESQAGGRASITMARGKMHKVVEEDEEADEEKEADAEGEGDEVKKADIVPDAVHEEEEGSGEEW